METDFLKPFINQNVEVLVGGVWIEGYLPPIAKGIVVLEPIGEAVHFYGQCAFRVEEIKAVRLVRSQATVVAPVVPPAAQPVGQVRSSLDQVTPGQRFSRK